MAVEVSVREAKARLSDLLNQALAGEEVVIVRGGRRVARLTPVQNAPAPRRIGSAKGEFVVPADFDEALPEQVLRGFGFD